MQTITALTLAIFALGALQFTEAANILAIFPYPGPSQYIVVLPYLKALAERGHQLTVISAFPQKEKIKNFRDIPAVEIIEKYDDLIGDITAKRYKWQELNHFTEFFMAVNLNILENEGVRRLLRSDEHFDLVIVETLQTDALFGFAEHFKAPLIGFSSYGTDRNIDSLVGNTSPLSYIPLLMADYTDHMNFLQRLENLYLNCVEWFHQQTVHLPLQVALYKKHFPHAKGDLLDLRQNFSLMLLNQHFSLSYPRPYVPNMIEVGGFHLQHKPAPLPADLAAFINASKNGVIYFSMGSNIRTTELPAEILQILLKTFASLPQNVLFKYEGDTLPGKPANVFISKWFPQPDVLAHPKVKLFITHGGLLSKIEAIYHGKPVVGIPMFYDQFLNLAQATKAGYGVSVDYRSISVESLKGAIVKVLTDPSYTRVAAKLSKRYHDQPLTPLDTAIYWTEYVLRHEGAPHMRVAAQDLNFIQYHNLDAIVVLIAAAILMMWAVYKSFHFVLTTKFSKLAKKKQR